MIEKEILDTYFDFKIIKPSMYVNHNDLLNTFITSQLCNAEKIVILQI